MEHRNSWVEFSYSFVIEPHLLTSTQKYQNFVRGMRTYKGPNYVQLILKWTRHGICVTTKRDTKLSYNRPTQMLYRNERTC